MTDYCCFQQDRGSDGNMVFIFLFILLAYSNFFGLVTNNIPFYLLNVFFTIYAVKTFSKNKELFPLFIYFGCIVSMISCSIIRKQNFMQSLAVNHTLLSIITFYFFIEKRRYYKSMISALQFFFIIFSICYIIQIIAFPSIIFPCSVANIEIENVSAKYKFYFPGLAIIPFAIFYNFNKYLDYKKRLNLFFFILAILMMLFRVSRLQTIISFVLLLYFIRLYNGRFNGKIIFYIIISFIFLFFIANTQFSYEIFTFMLSKQENEVFTNEDYVRNLALDFFYNDFFVNDFEMFTGAGYPNIASNYGKWIDESRGIRTGYVDWGILGQSWMFGIVTAIGFLIMWIKPIVHFKFNKHNLYCKFFFLYILLISLLAITPFLVGNVVIQVVIFVITFQLRENKTTFQ